MTTIIKDLRENSEHAAQQWKIYQGAVRRIGDTESLREANESLGYNLVMTIPGLLEWIQELQEEKGKLRTELLDLRAKKLHQLSDEIERLKEDDRPIGIPAGHIILDVSDSLELEVVTEEAPNGEESENEIKDLMRPDHGYRSLRAL